VERKSATAAARPRGPGDVGTEHARRGIGRFIVSLCEAAAAREGFGPLDRVATVAGEPLYAACGFAIAERIEVSTPRGIAVPCARTRKAVNPVAAA